MTGLALRFAAPEIRTLLDEHGTLYAAAAARPDRREYGGRGVAYGVRWAGARVVVRHSRHGGLLAPLTRDLFLPPTRAPQERRSAVRLEERGVPTPEVVAYAVYQVGFFRRSDVVTREIEGARDLAACEPTPEAQAAVERLLAAMAEAGALHPDLNAKNILVAPDVDGLLAYVIDVDRVVFRRGVDHANRARLRRSIAKLQLGYRV